MRVALISTPFVSVPPSGYGGTELIVYELAEGLVDRGHDVTVFATGDSETRARLLWLFDTPSWPPDLLSELTHVSWAVRAIATDGKYDLVHIHSVAGIPFGASVGAPLVCTLHNERTDSLWNLYRNHPDVQYVAISHDQARRCAPLPGLEVIHHGIAPEPYGGPSQAADYVCFVGRFSRVKGLHTAVDAAGRAGVSIRVAGEIHPPDEEFAEREIVPRLALPHVRHLGPVGLEEKSRLLRSARALLAPIEWNEPFGLILIEAMLSGCPVVAYPRGSVPELVEPGVTGFVAKDLPEMVELIRPGGGLDSFDRRSCRERAVERFGRNRMTMDHERLYARVLSRESRPAVRRRRAGSEPRRLGI